MLVDFPPANLEESFAVWKAKESPAAVLLGSGEAEVRLFRWPRERSFTILEDFALRVLEDPNLGNTDEEIARILCLDKTDIDAIFNGSGLEGKIQGDSSHRELPKDFSRKNPDGVAIVDGDVPSASVEFRDDEWPTIDALEKSHGRAAGRGDLSKEQREWMKEKGARIFTLPVSAFRYDKKSWLFRCGGKTVPLPRNNELRKCFGKIGPKSAPSDAVCHRDEFWPWLKHRLGESPSGRVVFETKRHDDDAAEEWLREEMEIPADKRKLREVQKNGPEAVCLDDERFELRDDFVRRAAPKPPSS